MAAHRANAAQHSNGTAVVASPSSCSNQRVMCSKMWSPSEQDIGAGERRRRPKTKMAAASLPHDADANPTHTWKSPTHTWYNAGL